jgi:hypothetical protein
MIIAKGLKSSGALETGNPVSYIQYTVSSIGNIAAYNIKTFASSDTYMRDANGHLYPDAKIYYNYYGYYNYNEVFMNASLDIKGRSFDSKNLDFTNFGKCYFLCLKYYLFLSISDLEYLLFSIY